MKFVFHAFGHPSVRSSHKTTIEITKEPNLSPRGNCVVAVNSERGIRDLPEDLKRSLLSSKVKGQLVLSVGSFHFTVEGWGDPRLTFSHPADLIVRKSGFVSDRTVLIHADKSASDLPREMVRMLQDPESRMTIEISTIV